MITARVHLGPADKRPRRLEAGLELALARYYQGLDLQVYSARDTRTFGEDWSFISDTADFHMYAVVDRRRVIPVHRAPRQSANSALVRLAQISRQPIASPSHGEVVEIFSHEQPGHIKTAFAAVRTFLDYGPGLVDQSWCFWDK